MWKQNKKTVKLERTPLDTSEAVRPLSKKEMRAMVGGVTRRQYCKTLEMTYSANMEADFDLYRSAWLANCS